MQEILEPLLQAGALALTALGGLAVRRLADWLKLRADSEVRTYLALALDRAVEYGQAEARRRLGVTGGDTRAGSLTREALANQAAVLARDYAQSRVPDALARFKIDTPGLDQLIQARMPKPASTTQFQG